MKMKIKSKNTEYSVRVRKSHKLSTIDIHDHKEAAETIKTT